MRWILKFTLMTVSVLVASGRGAPFRPPNAGFACSGFISRETTTYRVPPDCPSVILTCYQGTCPQVVILTFDHVQSICFGHRFYGISSYSVLTSTGNIRVSEGRRKCIPELTNRNVSLTLHGHTGQVIFFNMVSLQEDSISLHTHRVSSFEEALAMLNELATS
ncbi:uncharacterized protein LOC110456322 [Mizuhopecten yessoensis]|uniref:Secreted protein n=1 Tax=Mizuhopecten yessoensis TaxID=6573 RepID=A0A210QB86_MIZYE|nr:uncharacterized protein LOC110456322 [Mizuhopecten yessoensis]OWF45997.1 hypothetical protein KP79_PYT15429 [Mizuhopecten yessoensis]